MILASGTGSLFSSIVEACKNQELKAKVVSLVTDNPRSLVLKRAQEAGIENTILNPKDFSHFLEWDARLLKHLKKKQADLILLAGFIKKIGPQVLASFPSRVLNIHPSLLPRHGGSGMYGMNVHRSVLKKRDKKTGSTIHLVSEEYDTGAVLAQAEIAISPGDTAESLSEKVKKLEQVFYVSTLKKILAGEIKL